MRLRQRDLKPYIVRERVSVREPGGNVYEDWSEDSHEIKANVQPAGGKLMLEMYGERLNYMMVAYLSLDNRIKETDGVYVNVETDKDPDYRVIALRAWNTHLVADLEKIR